jgi:hypothetical protein
MATKVSTNRCLISQFLQRVKHFIAYTLGAVQKIETQCRGLEGTNPLRGQSIGCRQVVGISGPVRTADSTARYVEKS